MRARAFAAVLSTETRKLMSYRLDFWLATVAAFVVELFLAWVLWSAIFRSSGQEQIGGYTLPSMVAYYTLVILLSRLVRGQDRGPDVSSDIYQGSLNRYLLYPAAYVPFKYAEHLGALAPGMVQAAVLGGLFVLFAGTADVTPSLGPVAAGLLFLGLANLLWFLLQFPLNCIAFWAENVWSLRVTVRFFAGLLGGLLLPLSVFPSGVESALYWTPFPYLYGYPALLLLGRDLPVSPQLGFVVLLAWLAALSAIGFTVWRRGIRTYSGVGI